MTDYPTDPWTPASPPETANRRHGKLIASIAAVVVLAGGGAATYIAFAADDSGSGSAKTAVQHLVADLEKADLIGVLDDLVPGERTALSAPIRADIASLKQLGVLSPKADPSSVSGVQFAAHDLSYADKTVTINDHVQIVKITGGTVDLGADVAQMPFTDRFLGLAKGAKGATSRHLDLSGREVRIAAEKVDGNWYASLFYTAADAAAGHAIPATADRVPALGADSPDGAVQKMVRALLSGDARSALALISPAELGAVHDYGGLILNAAPKWGPAPVSINTLDLTTTSISDGGVRVGLKKLVLTVGGRPISLAIDNGCAQLASGGLNRRVCPSDGADLISGFIGGITCAGAFSYGSASRGGGGVRVGGCGAKPTFTKAQKQALTDVLSGITKLGIDTAQVSGSWFVTPVRTVADLSATVLSGLKGDYLFELATLGR